jgi:nucleotide-binding universal stress UspA family protein
MLLQRKVAQMPAQIDPTETWDFAVTSTETFDPKLKIGPLDYQSILVPIDFSEHSKNTVQHATRLASNCGATVILLHVYQTPPVVAVHSRGASLKISELTSTENEAREKLAKAENELLQRGVDVIALLRTGSAFQQIAEVACQMNVDLIVIGSHGKSRIKHVVLGSTAEKVVQHAPCPVLVVKTRSWKVDLPARKTASKERFHHYLPRAREAAITETCAHS